MGTEKDSARVTLKFNSFDFRHKKTLAILRERPRFMTELVVNAILHYVSCPEVGQEINKAAVREVVTEVLREMAADGSLTGLKLSSPEGNSDAISVDDTNNIGSMMNAFR